MLISKKVKLIITCLLLLSSCSMLNKGELQKTAGKEKVELILSDYDHNNDGTLDKEEFQNVRASRSNDAVKPTVAMFQILGIVFAFCFLPKLISMLINGFAKKR